MFHFSFTSTPIGWITSRTTLTAGGTIYRQISNNTWLCISTLFRIWVIINGLSVRFQKNRFKWSLIGLICCDRLEPWALILLPCFKLNFWREITEISNVNPAEMCLKSSSAPQVSSVDNIYQLNQSWHLKALKQVGEEDDHISVCGSQKHYSKLNCAQAREQQ